MKSNIQLTKKFVDTNSHIDTITENVSEIIVKQTEQICEMMIWEENLTIKYTKENTFLINNDNSKVIFDIKE